MKFIAILTWVMAATLWGAAMFLACSPGKVTIDPADCDHIRTFKRDGRRMNLYLCAVETTVQEKFKQH